MYMKTRDAEGSIAGNRKVDKVYTITFRMRTMQNKILFFPHSEFRIHDVIFNVFRVISRRVYVFIIQRDCRRKEDCDTVSLIIHMYFMPLYSAVGNVVWENIVFS